MALVQQTEQGFEPTTPAQSEAHGSRSRAYTSASPTHSPRAPLPRTGLCPIEKTDPLRPLLDLEGMVGPNILGTPFATAA